jgi:YHS domain-containing protein
MAKNQRKVASPMVKDPVCNMMVDPHKAPARSDYMGKTYYFCNVACKESFDRNPAKYVRSSKASAHRGHHM